MCTLVARMVKMRPVTVTFFTAASVYERVKAEIARDFEPGQESSASRIRRVCGLPFQVSTPVLTVT